jgi:DNA-binding transcriptional ArsR family regulator
MLRSPEQFRALGHPLRHRLFNLLRQRPATLAQLAAALGATKGTVGYHVQLMMDAGVLRLAGTRQVRGGTERYYEPVSGGIRHDPDAADRTSALVQAALDEMLPHRRGDADFAVLQHVRLSQAQAREVATRVERFATNAVAPDSLAPDSIAPDSIAPDSITTDALAGDDPQAEPHADPYGLLVCLFRADIPVLPPDPLG